MKKLIALMMAGVMMIGTSAVVFAAEKGSEAGVTFVGIPDKGIVDPKNPPDEIKFPDEWGLVSMKIHFGKRDIMQMVAIGFNKFASRGDAVGQNALTEAIPDDLQTIDLGIVTPRSWTLNVTVGEFIGDNNIDDFWLALPKVASYSQLEFSEHDAPGIDSDDAIAPSRTSGALIASGTRGVFGLKFSGELSLLTSKVDDAGESTAVITWIFKAADI